MSEKQDSQDKSKSSGVKDVKLTATIDTRKGTLQLDLDSLRRSPKVKAQMLAAKNIFEDE